MKLISIQVGLPKELGDSTSGDPFDKPWKSGFLKTPVAGKVMVNRLNLAGDGQADLENHGGADKAINSYPREHLLHWEKALKLKLDPGAFGENFSVEEKTENEVCIGDKFQIGKVILQVSQPRQPCWKLARRWRVKDLAVQVEQTGKTGWYFRVLNEGTVEAPGEMTLIDSPHPEWTVSRANEIMHHRKDDHEAALALAACPSLSESWKNSLSRRAAQ